MPSEWKYHADGVGTAAEAQHDLDGSLKHVTIQLDSFKVRTWTEEEVEDDDIRTPEHMNWDEPTGLYEEYSDGANATMEFDVADGKASLKSIEAEDGDAIKPKHIRLLRAAERVLDSLGDVEEVGPTIETLERSYDEAEPIYIEKLDA